MIFSWNQFIDGLRKEITQLQGQTTLDSDTDIFIKELEKNHKEWHKKKEELAGDKDEGVRKLAAAHPLATPEIKAIAALLSN